MLALALLAGASGCAQAPDPHAPTVQVAAETAEYVARFESEAADHGRDVRVSDLVIQFGEVSAEPGEAAARGVCEVVSGQSPVITLSREAWDSSSDAEREELLFHELGHCVLGLTHEAGLNADGIPKSVMNPTEIDGAIYKQYRTFYLATLFK